MPKFRNTDEFDIFSVLGDDVLNAEKKIIKEQIHADVRELINEFLRRTKRSVGNAYL